MIEKTENPLGLDLERVERLIPQLQKCMDDWLESPASLSGLATLHDSGVEIQINLKGKKYPYNLEQLKKLKAELSDPVMIAAKEFA